MNKETQLQYLLEQLRTRLLVMCVTVEEAVESACVSLRHDNVARAEAVIEHDGKVDELENEIDDMALSLMARTQPVARDLRFVVGAVRMVVDLERIGDEAAGIAERAVLMQTLPKIPDFGQLEEMMRMAQKALHESIAAFRDGDAALALQICRGVDDIAQMEVRLIQSLMERLTNDALRPGIGGWCFMHAILIARSLNRIFRRASNIAEHVYFMVEGVSIKHRKVMRQ
ncbi:MAG: phosphate signaling complex protein PhoU [Deltaproteobacteria bacterium]|nr:phosphate signaling complex protein PhoU [Deltaproteobacteria bacterium]